MALSPLASALSFQQPIATPPQTSIAPTDVVGAYKMATDAANQQYLAKLQQQNAMWGGLAGLGSAGILVAPKLFGGAGAGAAAAGAPLSLAAPAAATAGTGAVAGSDALDLMMLGMV